MAGNTHLHDHCGVDACASEELAPTTPPIRRSKEANKEMEAGYLLEDHKSLVEEHFEAINRRFHQLQQGALDFTFPSNVSGM